MTARTRCRLVNPRECGELLYGRRFLLTGYKSYLWPAILYGSEAWCLKESEQVI